MWQIAQSFPFSHSSYCKRCVCVTRRFLCWETWCVSKWFSGQSSWNNISLQPTADLFYIYTHTQVTRARRDRFLQQRAFVSVMCSRVLQLQQIHRHLVVQVHGHAFMPSSILCFPWLSGLLTERGSGGFPLITNKEPTQISRSLKVHWTLTLSHNIFLQQQDVKRLQTVSEMTIIFDT